MQDKALLVGINDYDNYNKLKGCVNDVAFMSKLLVGDFHFPEENILRLTDKKANNKNIPRQDGLALRRRPAR